MVDLGLGGVDVDTSPLLTKSNTARLCQNASYDGTRQRLGGLTTRAGLEQFNTVVLGGPVLGGIDAPYIGVATATGSGGSRAGVGGVGQELLPEGLAPGDDGQIDGSGTLLPPGGLVGSEGRIGERKLFGGRRIILVGRHRVTGGVSNDNGTGWYMTSEEFQDAAWLLGDLDSPDTIDGAGPPGACRQSVPNPNTLPGIHAAPAASAIVGGWLYYAKNMVTIGGTPTVDVRGELRRTNGYTDESVARIERNPWNTDTVQANRIVSMLAANGGIYITVCDKGVTAGGEAVGTNDDWGRVLFYNTSTRMLTEVNMENPTVAAAGLPRTPYALAWYVDRIFFGSVQSDGVNNQATISYGQPDLAPVLELTRDTPFFRTTCMAVYKGELFAGFQMRDTGVGNIEFAQVYGRVAAHATSGTSPWTTRLTAGGGIAQANNILAAMVVFKDNLYVSFFNNTQTAKIYKYDGTTWTTQYTATTTVTRAPLNLFVDTNSAGTEILYAFGLSENSTMTWLSSTDGTTFTDRTATLETGVHGTTFATSYALPVFFAFDQK